MIESCTPKEGKVKIIAAFQCIGVLRSNLLECIGVLVPEERIFGHNTYFILVRTRQRNVVLIGASLMKKGVERRKQL